jgi:integrase
VFRHAITAGLRDGSNPVTLTLLPKSSAPSVKPGVYSLPEIQAVLGLLSGPAKAAVAVAAYAGLRLSEIQGLRSEDYNAVEATLEVRQTQWRRHINEPKSEAFKDWVPAIPALSTILAEYLATWTPTKKIVEGDYGEGREVLDTSLFPMDLVNLGARVVKKAFKQSGIKWRGWHSFRRGLASNLYDLGADDLVVQRILRHSEVIATRESYIKLRDPKVEAAMKKLSAAVKRRADKGRRELSNVVSHL